MQAVDMTSKIDRLIEKSLDTIGPKNQLRDACEYALLSPGKRFRPALVFMMADALGSALDVSGPALATEYFHTASLIADDLPCMDDEEMRRGTLTTHKMFGESTAHLASYALIAAGYGWIAKGERKEVCPLAIECAAINTGLLGASGGQFLDITPPTLTEASIIDIIHKKTSSLFELSFLFGWLFGGGDVDKVEAVRACARHFGLAFQIKDDLGDQEQDIKNGRAVNFANVVGVERATDRLKEEKRQYLAALASLNIKSEALSSLLQLL